MRSLSLVMWKKQEKSFETIAKDQNSAWMLALEMFDEETYLGAENNYNLFTLRKTSDALPDDERLRLQVLYFSILVPLLLKSESQVCQVAETLW